MVINAVKLIETLMENRSLCSMSQYPHGARTSRVCARAGGGGGACANNMCEKDRRDWLERRGRPAPAGGGLETRECKVHWHTLECVTGIKTTYARLHKNRKRNDIGSTTDRPTTRETNSTKQAACRLQRPARGLAALPPPPPPSPRPSAALVQRGPSLSSHELRHMGDCMPYQPRARSPRKQPTEVRGSRDRSEPRRASVHAHR